MNLPLFLVFCMPGELRDLSLLYIIVLLSIATTLTQARRSRSQASSVSDNQSEGNPPPSWEPLRSEH
jgi:hypothetical protein